MNKFIILFLMTVCTCAGAQPNAIPITEIDGSRVMTGFENMAFQSDETSFVNACLFVVDSVCSVKKDMVLSTDYDARSIQFKMLVGSLPSGKLSNVYQMEVTLRVQEHRVVYYISNMQLLPGERSLSKNPTFIDNLTPEKRQAHADILNDISQSVSAVVNKMLLFIGENKPSQITHWDEVRKGQVVKGLSLEEAKLAFGKPQYTSESRGETQWMYSSSFYLFFKDGVVSSFIR